MSVKNGSLLISAMLGSVVGHATDLGQGLEFGHIRLYGLRSNKVSDLYVGEFMLISIGIDWRSHIMNENK